MFLQNLNNEQKQAFLSLAHKFIVADGQLAPQEQAMLAAMKAEMGFSDTIQVLDSNLSELLHPFDSRSAKATALLEMIGLGYSDNDFHPEENEIVQHMACAFGISKDEILQMENWVVRQIMLTQEAGQFFE